MGLKKYNITGTKMLQVVMIAIGEILLMFTGIFLAFQVENWNDSRKERELEAFALNALSTEMQDNEKDLKVTMTYHERSSKALSILMTISFENYKSIPPKTIDSLLAEAQWAWTFNPKMGVIKSIISTGQIKNIRNQELRGFITSFEDIINDSNEESIMNNKLIIEQFMPLVNRFVGEGDRGKHLGFDLKESRFESNYKDLFANREFESLIAYMSLWRIDQITEEIQVHAQIAKGLEILKQELEASK